MLEKEAQALPAQPSERETLRQFRAMVRIARVVLLTVSGLLAARFAILALGIDETVAPWRWLMAVTHPMAAPAFDVWPDVHQMGHLEIEFQSLVAMAAYLALAHLLTRWARRPARS